MPIPTYGDLSRYGREADAYARQFGLTGRHNGDWDAFRHAYASAEMTRQYGPEWARAAGDLYETYGDVLNGQGSSERNMDLWNNARGRDIGTQSTSRQDSAQRARNGLTGDLITNPLDTRNRYYDDYRVPQNLPSTWEIEGWGDAIPIISSVIGTTPDPLVKARIYVDPLILDLDGDGIEITPLSAGIQFDANGDLIKSGTAWAGADDAMLVRDINGNGIIDSGREMFGDETILTTGVNMGKKASHGFTALADLNSNGDAVFDVLDAQYANLRTWKDLNQDGISQVGELQTLAAANIQTINLTATASNVALIGGNTQTFAGTFAREGGAVSAAGTAELVGSLLLTNNNFYRQFTDNPAVTTAAQALPQMQGSGWVRDLREAMRCKHVPRRRSKYILNRKITRLQQRGMYA